MVNEELIKRFYTEHNIAYVIIRIFNTYGKDDNFSIIHKIKNTYLIKKILVIINDVVSIYKFLLDPKHKTPNILNVASSKSTKVFNILNFLNFLKKNDILLDTGKKQRIEININKGKNLEK